MALTFFGSGREEQRRKLEGQSDMVELMQDLEVQILAYDFGQLPNLSGSHFPIISRVDTIIN